MRTQSCKHLLVHVLLRLVLDELRSKKYRRVSGIGSITKQYAGMLHVHTLRSPLGTGHLRCVLTSMTP